jgi:pilus assembly protein Flp/PilA
MVKFLNRLYQRMAGFCQDRQGATAIEYGLIAGGISLGVVAAIFFFGDSLQGLYDMIAEKMSEASAQVEE